MSKADKAQASEAGGHTFRPEMEACRACHENPQQELDQLQTEIEQQLTALKKRLDAVPDKASQEYRDALKNYDWVKNERSRGFHNAGYAKALLDYGMELASQAYFSEAKRNRR